MSVTFVRTDKSTVNYVTAGAYTSDSLLFNATNCDFIVVFIQGNKAAPPPSGFSVTYNGVSMTQVSGSPFGPDTTFSQEYIAAFYLAHPATGSNTLAASWTGAFSRESMGVMGFSDTDGTISGIQSSTTGANLTVTSTVPDMVVGAASSINNGSGITLSTAGATTDWNNSIGSPTNISDCGGHVPGAAPNVTVAFSGTREISVAFNIISLVPTLLQMLDLHVIKKRMVGY